MYELASRKMHFDRNDPVLGRCCLDKGFTILKNFCRMQFAVNTVTTCILNAKHVKYLTPKQDPPPYFKVKKWRKLRRNAEVKALEVSKASRIREINYEVIFCFHEVIVKSICGIVVNFIKFRLCLLFLNFLEGYFICWSYLRIRVNWARQV